jgi:predicted nucleic acid-binding protein
VSTGVTLDAGGLMALERNDRRVVALLARAQELGGEVIVPATALAQVVSVPARQGPLMRLLRQPRTTAVALGRADASFVGQLLAATGTADLADAHVVVCARRAGHAVVTSDPDDLQRLDPDLPLIDV